MRGREAPERGKAEKAHSVAARKGGGTQHHADSTTLKTQQTPASITGAQISSPALSCRHFGTENLPESSSARLKLRPEQIKFQK